MFCFINKIFNNINKILNSKKYKKIKILVAYHKKDILFKSDILVPIHVGRNVAKEESKDGVINDKDLNWLLSHMIGDNTGENISNINRQFCELTATYWAYRNYDKLGNPDYIGLMHYRTFFDLSNFSKKYNIKKMYSYKNINNILHKYDGVVSYPLNSLKDLCNEMLYEDVNNNYLHLTDKNYRKFNIGFQQYLKDRNVHFKNMYILKKEDFFEMCDEIFPLLKEIYRENKNNFPSRMCGYIAEILTSFFFKYLESKNQKFYYAKWFLPKEEQSILQTIFSIKNSDNKNHKIITILGVKISIKRGNK